MLPEITLHPLKEKSLLRRHPWIYSQAIARTPRGLADGGAVRVCDHHGRFLCYGIYSSRSQIRVRALSFDEQELIDGELVRRRLRRARELRLPLLARGNRACRLVAGEGDGLPGLVADLYDHTIVISISAWAAECLRDEIVAALGELCPQCSIYERSDSPARRLEGLEPRCGDVVGTTPDRISYVLENDSVEIPVDIVGGHKTGAYLDQRANRARLLGLCEGRDVLNCFSYTGAFGLYALRGGARSVINVDTSRRAGSVARQAAAHNHLDPGRCRFVPADGFDYLRSEVSHGRKYGVIVLDPPKFIRSRHEMLRGCRAYQDLNRHAFRLLEPGGHLLTFSCSGLLEPSLFQKIVADAALEAGTEAVILDTLRQADDHVVALPCPEGFYLKGLHAVIV